MEQFDLFMTKSSSSGFLANDRIYMYTYTCIMSKLSLVTRIRFSI